MIIRNQTLSNSYQQSHIKNYLGFCHAEDQSPSLAASFPSFGVQFVYRQHKVIFEPTKRYHILVFMNIYSSLKREF